MDLTGIGGLIVAILLTATVLVILWRVIRSAVRAALQDHTIWLHTKWPDMQKGLDDGRLDESGFRKR